MRVFLLFILLSVSLTRGQAEILSVLFYVVSPAPGTISRNYLLNFHFMDEKSKKHRYFLLFCLSLSLFFFHTSQIK